MFSVIAPILNIPSRNLQIFRYVFLSLAIIALIITLLGPTVSPSTMYYSQITAGHLDVLKGIYDVLRNQAMPSKLLFALSGIHIPVDSTLSNSEIEIFTLYAQQMVLSAPQYIVNSLWKRCNCYYETAYDLTGKVSEVHKDQRLECSKTNDNAFDYRAQFEASGLLVIIAYSGLDDEVGYIQKTQRWSKMFKIVPGTFYYGISSQVLIMILGFVAFGPLEAKSDLKSRKSLLVHAIGVLSVLSFLSVCVGVSVMMYLVKAVQKDILEMLSNFGIVEVVGAVWFSMAWLLFAFSLFDMLLWILPLWCANPDQELYLDDTSSIEVNVGKSRSRTLAFLRQKTKATMDTEYSDYTPTTSYKDGPFMEEVRLLNSLGTLQGLTRRNSTEDYELDRLYDSKPQEPSGFIGEAELRRMGESLSRKPSVRKLNSVRNPRSRLLKRSDRSDGSEFIGNMDFNPGSSSKIRSSSDLTYTRGNLSRAKSSAGQISSSLNQARFPGRSLTNPALSDAYPVWNPSNAHIQEKTYDGYTESPEEPVAGPSRSGTIGTIGRSEYFDPKKGYLSDEDQINPEHDLLNAFLKRENRKSAGEESFLNDDEVEFLDLNNFVNKMV